MKIDPESSSRSPCASPVVAGRCGVPTNSLCALLGVAQSPNTRSPDRCAFSISALRARAQVDVMTRAEYAREGGPMALRGQLCLNTCYAGRRPVSGTQSARSRCLYWAGISSRSKARCWKLGCLPYSVRSRSWPGSAMRATARSAHSSRTRTRGPFSCSRLCNDKCPCTRLIRSSPRWVKGERAISVSGYVHRGLVKYTDRAFEKTMVYKQRSRNHLLDQVESFRIGDRESDREDDLLDTFYYGIAVALATLWFGASCALSMAPGFSSEVAPENSSVGGWRSAIIWIGASFFC